MGPRPTPAARTILHADMDAFFVSVELLRRPELQGRPVVVGGTGERGVVAAASYEARRYGIHSAMPSTVARRRCPDAVFLPGDHARYEEVSGQIQAIFRRYTPLVEPISLDEAFLDVTGSLRLFGPAEASRPRLRRDIGVELSAHLQHRRGALQAAGQAGLGGGQAGGDSASRVDTGSGRGRRRARARSWPSSTRSRSRRSGASARRHEPGWTAWASRTVGELAEVPLPSLVAALGSAHGRHLHDLACRHRRPRGGARPGASSRSATRRPSRRTSTAAMSSRAVLVRQADAVAHRLRAQAVVARTVTIKVRYGDFTTLTRSVTLPQPVWPARRLAEAAGGCSISST